MVFVNCGNLWRKNVISYLRLIVLLVDINFVATIAKLLLFFVPARLMLLFLLSQQI